MDNTIVPRWEITRSFTSPLSSGVEKKENEVNYVEIQDAKDGLLSATAMTSPLGTSAIDARLLAI